jgi:hypothetical protein
MAAPTMRRPLLALLGIVTALALPSPSASAQEEPQVTLSLLSLTPWNSSYDPEHGRDVVVRFRAENEGASAVDDLSIGVALYGRAISRSAYEASLTTDPAVIIDAATFGREDTLEPGVPREFEVSLTLDSGIDPDDSGVYPLKVELRSGFTSLAAIRSAVVFLVREPEIPLSLSWTFVLQQPIVLGPDGTFTSTALEEALEPEGRLAAQIRALLGLATDPAAPAVDVAMAPTLLTQLDRMSRGYTVATDTGVRDVAPGEGGAALAEQALEDLRAIAAFPGVLVTALPYSSPELPSLVSGGLGRDVPTQIDRGRQVVGELMETTPTTSVLRPPGAALNEETVRTLPQFGVSTLVAGPFTVTPSPQPLGFAGPPTAGLGEDGGLVAIVPEPGLMERLQAPSALDDPVLTAQTVLGELATIWQEQPGVERGVALVVSEDLLAQPTLYGALARGVAGAPWLDTMHAGEFALRFPPEAPSALTAPTPRTFGSAYVSELRRARRRVDVYRSMLVEPSTLPDEYDHMLLLAESRQFLSSPDAGLAFIAHVRDSTGAVFEAVGVDAVDEITLASATGSPIPVTVTNGADEALRVTVQLISSRLEGTPSIELELAAGASETVTFRVDVRSTGAFTVEVRVAAPAGRILASEQFTVRSTVYNRIALTITIAAALLLLALWVRRFLPRRTS